MKAIYFKENNTNPMMKMSHLTTSTVATLFPFISNYIGLKVLCNPFSKRTYSFDTKLAPETFNIDSQYGPIKLYNFKGTGETVLLTHGWSDNSSSFSELINELIEQGLNVWTFDHIGHGQSQGSTAHLFAFINGLKKVRDFIQNTQQQRIDHLIGHSMGSVAIMNLEKDFLNERKTIFISTPVKFFEIMFAKIASAGFSHIFLKTLLENVSKKNNGDWQRLRPYHQFPKLNANSLFIHDVKDKYAPFYDIQVAQESSKFNLISTSGLGHVRILKSDELKKIIMEHLS
ncbi:MAG: hypothetical protein BM556_12640 [Bacteriovorax sp. MedPE-SWde]|nr:MAG: hypothetical protein BM556_12640 [Bacteriovorax sp. MedPE-SWde]